MLRRTHVRRVVRIPRRALSSPPAPPLVVRTLYRQLLRAAREFDARPTLKAGLLRPDPVGEAAAEAEGGGGGLRLEPVSVTSDEEGGGVVAFIVRRVDAEEDEDEEADEDEDEDGHHYRDRDEEGLDAGVSDARSRLRAAGRVPGESGRSAPAVMQTVEQMLDSVCDDVFSGPDGILYQPGVRLGDVVSRWFRSAASLSRLDPNPLGLDHAELMRVGFLALGELSDQRARMLEAGMLGPPSAGPQPERPTHEELLARPGGARLAGTGAGGLAAGVCLVSHPAMGDPHFRRKVVLLTRRDEKRGGWSGLVLNTAASQHMRDVVFPSAEAEAAAREAEAADEAAFAAAADAKENGEEAAEGEDGDNRDEADGDDIAAEEDYERRSELLRKALRREARRVVRQLRKDAGVAADDAGHVSAEELRGLAAVAARIAASAEDEADAEADGAGGVLAMVPPSAETVAAIEAFVREIESGRGGPVDTGFDGLAAMLGAQDGAAAGPRAGAAPLAADAEADGSGGGVAGGGAGALAAAGGEEAAAAGAAAAGERVEKADEFADDGEEDEFDDDLDDEEEEEDDDDRYAAEAWDPDVLEPVLRIPAQRLRSLEGVPVHIGGPVALSDGGTAPSVSVLAARAPGTAGVAAAAAATATAAAAGNGNAGGEDESAAAPLPRAAALLKAEPLAENLMWGSGVSVLSSLGKFLREHPSITRREKAGRFRIFFKESGWAEGQLESELEQGTWFLARVDDELLLADWMDSPADCDDFWVKVMLHLGGEHAGMAEWPRGVRWPRYY